MFLGGKVESRLGTKGGGVGEAASAIKEAELNGVGRTWGAERGDAAEEER